MFSLLSVDSNVDENYGLGNILDEGLILFGALVVLVAY